MEVINQRSGFVSFVIIVIVAVALALGGGFFYYVKKSSAPPVPQPVERLCGGVAAIQCPVGYICKPDGTYPDAGGHCVTSSTNGTLAGHVSIGPICPVERVGVPCPVPPEAYAAREFIVFGNDQKETTRFHAGADGNYSVSLPPNMYTVISAKIGMGSMSKDLPATVTIKAGQTTMLNIDVDTGIR